MRRGARDVFVRAAASVVLEAFVQATTFIVLEAFVLELVVGYDLVALAKIVVKN